MLNWEKVEDGFRDFMSSMIQRQLHVRFQHIFISTFVYTSPLSPHSPDSERVSQSSWVGRDSLWMAVGIWRVWCWSSICLLICISSSACRQLYMGRMLDMRGLFLIRSWPVYALAILSSYHGCPWRSPPLCSCHFAYMSWISSHRIWQWSYGRVRTSFNILLYTR